ncbi:MAG: hypothetical protein PHU47_00910 [Candidatus ainarchaeum sp.]|nr:hypothetical protein [Candidatus ainarchaeum sp.]
MIFLTILILSCLLGLIISIFFLSYFKTFFIYRDIIAIDQQKKEKPVLPQSGGFPVFLGILIGVCFFLLISIFYFPINNSLILVSLLSILLAMLVGFFDDINLSKKPVKNIYGDLEIRVGLTQITKPILTFIAAIPLMALLVGDFLITLPFIGSINLGYFYPLFFVPIFFIVFTNATNMLAGTNGLESGSMFLITLFLGVFCLLNNRIEAAAISLISCFAIIPFLVNNWYPAKILPGDSLTYLFGAVYATVAIVGNVEMFATFIFIPWAIEILLKLRGGLKVRSLGNLQKDGTLKKPYNKIYSWTHIMMWIPEWFGKRAKEYQVTIAILGVELFVIVIGFILFL